MTCKMNTGHFSKNKTRLCVLLLTPCFPYQCSLLPRPLRPHYVLAYTPAPALCRDATPCRAVYINFPWHSDQQFRYNYFWVVSPKLLSGLASNFTDMILKGCRCSFHGWCTLAYIPLDTVINSNFWVVFPKVLDWPQTFKVQTWSFIGVVDVPFWVVYFGLHFPWHRDQYYSNFGYFQTVYPKALKGLASNFTYMILRGGRCELGGVYSGLF